MYKSKNSAEHAVDTIDHRSIVSRYPLLSLSPLLLFVLSFVGTGIALTLQGFEKPFYQVSPTVIILPAIILSIALSRESVPRAIQQFLAGAGHINVMTMCFIFLFAGAFGQVAGAIGGVESTVNLALSLTPTGWILPGVLMVSSFIALSMGTSMGTIAALAPIALGIAKATGIPPAIIMGALVGGAMFGDNLSVISDTTIAATQTQNCDLRDKFRFNAKIAIPAVVITILILWSMGYQGNVQEIGEYQLVKVLPYVVILLLALLGVNVLAVLMIGILLAGAVGYLYVDGFTTLVFSQNLFEGFSLPREIFFLSMMIGGLGGLVKSQGGIASLIHVIVKITKKVSGKEKSVVAGQLGICSLVSIADICTANNTVAILITGDAARQIAAKNDIDPKSTAGLLDIFACVFQGLLPYSAQILLAGALGGLSPLAIVANVHYCLVLGVLALLVVVFQYPASKLKKRQNTQEGDKM